MPLVKKKLWDRFNPFLDFIPKKSGNLQLFYEVQLSGLNTLKIKDENRSKKKDVDSKPVPVSCSANWFLDKTGWKRLNSTETKMKKQSLFAHCRYGLSW